MTVTDDSDAPPVDDRDPTELIGHAVADVLALARTWLAWDGRGRYGDGNTWTPHKALRRVQDHLLDHLAEVHARLAGSETVPDTWHGRTVTTDADWARFTEVDLDEATSRLLRFAGLYRDTARALSPAQLDEPRGDAWTIRQIYHHVANVTFYAEQVGSLVDG